MFGEPAEPLIGGISLLERAINFTLGSLHLVTEDDLPRPTPCHAWDVRALLWHMEDSVLALHEAADLGHVDIDENSPDPVEDPVAALRDRACRLVGAWARGTGPGVVSIAGTPLTAGILTGTGAIEVAVHGWDLAMACGRPRAIPGNLAEEMLPLSPLFVTEADRPGRVAPQVPPPPSAGPAARLLAFLGREV
jgi:uncharacterized protein (TIGR03086 family)